LPESKATGNPAGLLLTGATGFVGQQLQQQLLTKQNLQLTALVRESTPGRRAELHPNADQRSFSLTNPSAWTELLQEFPGRPLVLMAGSVRGRTYRDFEGANVDIVKAATLALSQLTQPPPTLLISSLAASQPALSHYAASKFAGEEQLASSTIPWTILRPTAVYGRGDKELAGLFRAVRLGLVPRLGPKHQRLSFVHVSDLCQAIEAWLQAPQACHQQRFSIDDGTRDGYSWSELAQAIAPDKNKLELGVPRAILSILARLNLAGAYLLRYQPMLSPGKVRELCYPGWLCDNVPFSRATGWQPKISLHQGANDYLPIEENS